MVRIKNRYLLVNILYPEPEATSRAPHVQDLIAINQPTTDLLTPQALLNGIKAEISLLFGDYGIGAIADNLSVKYLSPATSTLILRVARAHYQMLWAALSLMRSVPVKDGKKCVFQVVRVSGTMRKTEEEAIRRARQLIARAIRENAECTESTLDLICGTAQLNSKDTPMVDLSENGEETSTDDD